LAALPRCGFASGPKLRLRRGSAAAFEGARSAEGARRTRREPPGPRTREAAGPGPARPAIFARAGFAHGERTSVEHLAVELLNRLLGVRAVEELDEREPARTPGFPVDRQHDLRRRRHGSEIAPQIGFGGAVSEITDEQTNGQSTLS